MNGETFTRLHSLRMENDEAGYRQEEMRPRFAALVARHENGTAPRAIAVHQLFQTPPDLARELVHSLGAQWVYGCRVLEPSAGLARIVDALQDAKAAEVVAVEVAPECAGELFRQNREAVTLYQRDFLTCTPAELGLFDSVAMNPPFTMRSDIRHILHALTFLKPGGRCAALMLDTPHREKALRSLSATWDKIPAGRFAKEGTRVACVLATFTKPANNAATPP